MKFNQKEKKKKEEEEKKKKNSRAPTHGYLIKLGAG